MVIRAEVAKAADAAAIEIDRHVLRHTSQVVAAGQALAEAPGVPDGTSTSVTFFDFRARLE